ncbi:type II toxin-antitoxin system prevent-host-death family antitoxin [Rathayibacter sp. YIM 133350]|uniref:type II toxin-antitoxin system Phd/YefM family antitoxin n=1 Tax=Rathayibacter sp. YIM 133350 TaxID=3131992 RepID=UPI00307EC071
MSEPMNILDARNNLSKIVAAASAGTDTVIAKRGRPVARVTRVLSSDELTAAGLVDWLIENPLAASAPRTSEQLDEQIGTERGGWE